MEKILIAQQIKQLFTRYINGFKEYDLAAITACYQLPSCLSTPEQFLLLDNSEKFEHEFQQIFNQLKQANTKTFTLSNVSYTEISSTLILLHGIWTFIDDSEQVFAQFSASYHMVTGDNQLKIVNVISHQVDHTLTLTHPIEIEQE